MLPPSPVVLAALVPERQQPAPRRPEPEPPPEPRRYRRSEDRPAVLDVVARRNDVISIARSMDLWRTCLALGHDPDDLEQELLIRVWRRQSTTMKSRYDPERACVSKYLHILCRSILMNMVEARQSLAARSEQVGCLAYDGSVGKVREVDAALAAVAVEEDPRVVREDDDPELFAWMLE